MPTTRRCRSRTSAGSPLHCRISGRYGLPNNRAGLRLSAERFGHSVRNSFSSSGGPIRALTICSTTRLLPASATRSFWVLVRCDGIFRCAAV